MSNRILTHPDRSGFQLARKCLLGDIRRIKAEIRAAERSVFSPEVRRLYAAELAARTNLVIPAPPLLRQAGRSAAVGRAARRGGGLSNDL